MIQNVTREKQTWLPSSQTYRVTLESIDITSIINPHRHDNIVVTFVQTIAIKP